MIRTHTRIVQLAALVAVLLVAGPARAQQVVTVGPISTANRIAIDVTNEASAQTASALTFRVRVDVPVTGAFTALTGITCAPMVPAEPGAFTCITAVPQAVVDKVNVRGPHQITVTAFDGTSESPSSLPFALPVPPASPRGVRVLP